MNWFGNLMSGPKRNWLVQISNIHCDVIGFGRTVKIFGECKIQFFDQFRSVDFPINFPLHTAKQRVTSSICFSESEQFHFI